jgi:hypothetical protein
MRQCWGHIASSAEAGWQEGADTERRQILRQLLWLHALAIRIEHRVRLI